MSARCYGLLAEFRGADELLRAVRQMRATGYRRLEAYAPFPVNGLAEALGQRGNRIAPWTLLGGALGGAGGYFLQWYSAVVSYPINAGGRPLHSWPAFIPIVFELTMLGAAVAAVISLLVIIGLPRLHHPLFNVAAFDLASRNRFFLCVESADPQFDAIITRDALQALAPCLLCEVSR